MSFLHRKIDVEISLESGQFGGGGNSTRIKDKRTTAKIVNYGGASMGQLEMSIYGLPLQMMNQLTTMGTQINLVAKNKIKVYAGVEGKMPLIFEGTIATAYMDGMAMPHVPFRISAFAGLYEAVQKVEPTTKEGDVDAAPIFKELAEKMGLKFENNGVEAKIASPYLPRSPRDQVMKLAHDIGCQWIIDRGVLAIWPSGKTRNGDGWKVSRSTGMVAYPAFNQAGVVVTTLFDAAIRPGGKITIESDVTPANGDWTTYAISVDLASEVPKGPWFATIMASRIGEAIP